LLRPHLPAGQIFVPVGADYVSQRTDGRDRRAHDSPAYWAHDLRDRQGGEICIEHGEMAFLVDDLRNVLTTGGRWLRANAARSALDASRKKT
jgi:hypothetical protein